VAEGRPRTVPLGRVFRLPHNAFWSDGRPLTAVDVRESLGLLKKGSVVGALPALGELLDDVSVDDPFRVQLKLKQGFVDPLSLMTFKIMPPGCTDPNFATIRRPGRSPHSREHTPRPVARFDAHGGVAGPPESRRLQGQGPDPD
jgi:hypothetical protein